MYVESYSLISVSPLPFSMRWGRAAVWPHSFYLAVWICLCVAHTQRREGDADEGMRD